jgi:hypothetical protein
MVEIIITTPSHFCGFGLNIFLKRGCILGWSFGSRAQIDPISGPMFPAPRLLSGERN